MRNLAVAGALALTLALGGCAALPKQLGGSAPPARNRQLAQAVTLIGKGDSAGARKLLTAVVEAPPKLGVTDEALFRLALLHLKAASDRESNATAHHLLRRLKREYPGSIWNQQAQPLGELLAGTDDLRRQNRSCKSQNQSLSKENEELNRNINQMKHLDLELERKNR